MSTGRSGVAQAVTEGPTPADELGDERPADLSVTHPLALRALTVLWPAFLMAGVLEMLTFVVVDPSDLRWFGGESLGWSSSAIYTVTFLIYWVVIGISGALTVLLGAESAVTEARGLARHWP